jgi:hypothetical protein
MAMKILTALTHFVREPLSAKHFVKHAFEALAGVVINFFAISGAMAVFEAGGIPMVWAQLLAAECKSYGLTIAECTSDGSWWVGSLLGLGLLFMVGGWLIEAFAFGKAD